MMAEGNIENTPVNASELSIDSNGENKISPSSKLNTTEADGLGIYLEYHESEIQQNEKIYKLARAIIWTGFGVMMLGVLACFLGQTTPAILTASAGVITELISGTILAFLSQTSKSKQNYYKQLSFDQECNKYIKVIQSLNVDDDKKAEMLGELIKNYCQRRQ